MLFRVILWLSSGGFASSSPFLVRGNTAAVRQEIQLSAARISRAASSSAIISDILGGVCLFECGLTDA
jgi:hypothetical protein